MSPHNFFWRSRLRSGRHSGKKRQPIGHSFCRERASTRILVALRLWGIVFVHTSHALDDLQKLQFMEGRRKHKEGAR